MKEIIEGIPPIEVGKWYFMRAKQSHEWAVEGATKFLMIGLVLGFTHEGHVVVRMRDATIWDCSVRTCCILRSDILAEAQEYHIPGFYGKLIATILLGIAFICGAAYLGCLLNENLK